MLRRSGSPLVKLVLYSFHSIPFPLQSSDVHSVKEALEIMCIRESVSLSGSAKEVSN